MLSVDEWDAKQVARWMETLGLGQYSSMFQMHNVEGEALELLDHGDLEEIGVHSVGHRVKILRAISEAVPEIQTRLDQSQLQERLVATERQLRKLTDAYNRIRTDMLPLVRRAKENEPLPTPTGLSMPSTSPGFNQVSPTSTSRRITSPVSEMPQPHEPRSSQIHDQRSSASRERSSAVGTNSSLHTPVNNSFAPLQRTGPSHIIHADVSSTRSPSNTTGSVSLSTAAEPFKSFRVTMDDPCTKILPVVLRKYKILGDTSNYRLLVAYGDQERELGDHEKPLYLYKELQDAGLRPVFMVRQIIRDTQGSISGSRTPGGII